MEKTPSKADFDRADAMMAAGNRNLDLVEENVKCQFMSRCQLFKVFVLWQGDLSFRAYIFFRKNSDLATCKHNGIVDEIADFVCDELERVGRGKKEEIKVVFEFDSDENVIQNFDGDYFDRLR